MPATITAIDEEGKESPASIVQIAYDGLLAGDYEVVADWRSKLVKNALSGPIEGLYPQLSTAAHTSGAGRAENKP